LRQNTGDGAGDRPLPIVNREDHRDERIGHLAGMAT
jgi:hypothetical protein